MRTGRGLRICLDARIVSGVSGGLERTLIGIAHGLSALDDGQEEYFFLTSAGTEDWIKPHLDGPCRTLLSKNRHFQPTGLRRIKQQFRRNLPRVYRALASVPLPASLRMISVPQSDGTIERAEIDVMHFTLQDGFATSIPSVYLLWDLQHLHLPQFFTRRERWAREKYYKRFCNDAKVIAVASEWTRRDLLRHYKVPNEKVVVIPMAPPLDAFSEPSETDLLNVTEKFSLPERYAFYPAQTFAHKNHIRLLHALASLRDRHGVVVPLVCCGALNAFYPEIQRTIKALNLEDQVRFLGFVTDSEVQSLYNLCHCVVFPTLFEGWGHPLFEAFSSGVPVACSTVTCLPEYAGDAALLFDPLNVEAISSAVHRVWLEEDLRASLVAAGRERLRNLSWMNTMLTFRALYRRIGDYPLTEEDQRLLTTLQCSLPL